MHEAVATNWNGSEVSVTFKAKADDLKTLAERAHKAFHDEGKWTIQLKTIDGIEVAAEFRYHK